MTRASVLACILLLSGCESAAEASERLSLEGRGLLDAHDFGAAVERFTRATEADPSRFDAWSGLAASHAGLSHWPEARAAADRCIAITDDPACRVVHADAALHAEDWATAIDDHTRALALDPARVELYLARARASAHLEDVARTDGFYREAIDHGVEPAASRLELALLLLDRCGVPEGMDEARATATTADRTKVRDLLTEARPLASGETLAQIDAAMARSTALDDAARAATPNPDWFAADRELGPGLLDLLGDEIGDSFGMGGLGDVGSLGSSPSASETIGLGSLGTIGHGAGTGSAIGFGSGAGLRGSPPPPRNPNEN